MIAIALALFTAVAPAAFPQTNPKEVRAKFTAAHASSDAKACAALWRAHPGVVLQVIDADLEGSLNVREKAKAETLTADEQKKVDEMHARALFGARAAYEASGDPLILDYASSFVAWDAAQRKSFREGQKAYSVAMDAVQKNDAKAALSAGEQCLALASPLGDWWGTQMGYEAIARAKQAGGDKAGALEAWSYARSISRSLGLQSGELAALAEMSTVAAELGRNARALACAEQGAALAKKIGAADAAKELEAAVAKLKAAK